MAAKNLSNAGVLYTDRRDFYLSPQLTKELWGSITPYTTIVSNRRMRTGLKDPLFKGFEHRSPWAKQYFSINNAGGYTITTSGVSNVAIDGITGLNSTVDSSYEGLEIEFWNSSKTTRKGVALITAASTTLTLKSLTGASFSVADNDIGFVVGNAFGEGTNAPEAWADELDVFWNQCQIFKTPIEITGTLYEAALRGYSNELARLRMEKNKEHKIHKEKAFLLGTSPLGIGQSGDSFSDGDVTDANGKVVRTTYGIVSAIEDYGTTSGDDQNIFTIDSSTYTYSDFVDDMEKVFAYEPEAGYKYALAGPGAISYWSKMDGTNFLSGKSGWVVNMSEEKKDSLGFNFRFLETPHGILKLVKEPIFKNPSPRNGYMLVLNDENLEYLQYRPSKFQANIKTDNAYDGVKDQYFSDEGVAVGLLESHKLFKIS